MCIICGSTRATTVFEAGKAQAHAVLRCDQCGLMYLDHPDGELCTDEIEERGGGFPMSAQYIEKQTRQLRDYCRMFRSLEDRMPPGGTVLEVGANTGAFLNYLRGKGYHVTGVEPNQWCVDYAREHFGLDMLATDLCHSQLEPEHFNMVVMMHVIEHLKDPNIELMEIRRVLKPGGILVLETPTYDSWSFKLLQHRERSVRVRSHLMFFTPQTLKALLRKNGFDVLNTEYVGRTLSLERLIYNVGLMSFGTMERVLRTLADRTGLGKRELHINLHDMQRVFAVK